MIFFFHFSNFDFHKQLKQHYITTSLHPYCIFFSYYFYFIMINGNKYKNVVLNVVLDIRCRVERFRYR